MSDGDTTSAHRSHRALTVLAVLAVGAAAYVMRSLLVPVVSAVVLSFLFAPFVRRLQRAGLPAGLGAALVVGALLAATTFGAYALATPVSEWSREIPGALSKVEKHARRWKTPVKAVTKASKQVEKITSMGTNAGGAKAAAPVRLQGPSLTEVAMQNGTNLLAQAFLVVVMLFFLLAAREDAIRQWFQGTDSRAKAREVLHCVEHDVSSYLSVITVINVLLGAATSLAMVWFGMPNPIMWGVLAAVLNYIPYLGALAGVVLFGAGALVVFDNATQALAVAGTAWLLTSIEGYFITPLVLSRKFSLNPLVLLGSVLLLGWMWDVAGAFLAVPLLVLTKSACSRIPSMNRVARWIAC